MLIADLSTTTPLMLVRLSRQWRPLVEEVEAGYFRKGGGWYEGIDSETLRDSVRAWWRFKPATVDERGIEHVAAVLAGRTLAVYKLNGLIGPRADGRWAMWIEEITSGPLFDEIVGTTGRLIYFRHGSASPIRYWPLAGAQ